MRLDVTNLKSFDVQLKKFAATIEADVRKVRDKVGLDLFTIFVMDSPVDSGRFRASWMTAYHQIDTTVKPEGQHGRPDKPLLGNSNPWATLFITNSLPYGPRLNDGWSQQAPKHFVENGIEKVQQSIVAQL